MRLTGVPSLRPDVTSPAPSSTEPTATDASPTSTSGTCRVRFGRATRQTPVAEATSSTRGTTSEPATPRRRRSLVVFTPPKTTDAERQELRVLGALLSHVEDTDFYTNDTQVLNGLIEGGQHVEQVAPDEFPRGTTIITFKVERRREPENGDVHLPDITTLKKFVEAAVGVLGSRWATKQDHQDETPQREDPDMDR
jgi:hypothetical protein